jgi:hypothetical protein
MTSVDETLVCYFSKREKKIVCMRERDLIWFEDAKLKAMIEELSEMISEMDINFPSLEGSSVELVDAVRKYVAKMKLYEMCFLVSDLVSDFLEERQNYEAECFELQKWSMLMT